MIEILKFKEGNASNRPFLFLKRFAKDKKPKNKKSQGRKAIAQFSDAEIQDFRHFYLIHDLCRGLI
jgi:hypothetical protein